MASTTLAPNANDTVADAVMERLQNLEVLVKELRGELEQSRSGAGSSAGGPSGAGSPQSSTQSRDLQAHEQSSLGVEADSAHAQFGRLVLQDAYRSRYVSSGFWSRIEDEVSHRSRPRSFLGCSDYNIRCSLMR